MAAPERFARGLDISKYDIHYRAPVRPVDFVIQRAIYGLKSDERFEPLHAEIQPVPLRGAYHYYNTGIPWQPQAEHFLRRIESRGYHFLALDYELLFNNLNAASAQDAQRIMQFWRAETGKQMLLYCNPNVYENYLLPYGNWMPEWPLWISQWHSKWWYRNRASAPKLPRGVPDWAFWQYGGDYQHPFRAFGLCRAITKAPPGAWMPSMSILMSSMARPKSCANGQGWGKKRRRICRPQRPPTPQTLPAWTNSLA